MHIEARVPAPGVVIGRYGSTDAVFFVDQDFWPHNTSLFVSDFQGNRRRWCYYMLCTISKRDHASKSAVPGVDRKDLFDIRVPVPSAYEQATIVGYLDVAAVELSHLISTIQREIALLREFRVRLIADVVTGRLDVRAAAALLPKTPEEPLSGGEAEELTEEPFEEEDDFEEAAA